jgi:hypothetical protein
VATFSTFGSVRSSVAEMKFQRACMYGMACGHFCVNCLSVCARACVFLEFDDRGCGIEFLGFSPTSHGLKLFSPTKSSLTGIQGSITVSVVCVVCVRMHLCVFV